MKTFLVFICPTGDEPEPDSIPEKVVGIVKAETEEAAERKLGIEKDELLDLPIGPTGVFILEATEISTPDDLRKHCCAFKVIDGLVNR